MKQIKIALILFILNGLLFSQQHEIPQLIESDIPGIKIIREQSFDGSGLWGYINGGADIFLEYGFDKLFLQEIEIDQYNFKIEIYKMIDPQSAFGIYSVSHYKCDKNFPLTKYNCISQYQIQCAAGDYYISIINTNGSKKEQELSIALFEKVVSKISYGGFELPEIFHKKFFDGSRDQIKYFKGILGVQNGLSEWYDYFDKFEGYEIFILPTKLSDSDVNISQIKFSSPIDTKLFLNNLGVDLGDTEKIADKELNGIRRFVKMINETEMILIESYASIDNFESFIKRLID